MHVYTSEVGSIGLTRTAMMVDRRTIQTEKVSMVLGAKHLRTIQESRARRDQAVRLDGRHTAPDAREPDSQALVTIGVTG